MLTTTLYESWVLAELIPHLAASLARNALAEALETLRQGNPELRYAAAQLTRQVPRAMAEALWSQGEPSPQGKGPAELLVAALDRESRMGLGYDKDWPFLSWRDSGWHLDSRGFTAAAPWLDEEKVGRILATVLEAAEGARPPAFDILPGLHFEGLMSAVPAPGATYVVQQLRSHLRHDQLLICLMQLLPLMEGQDRAEAAAEVFSNPWDLPDFDLNTIEVVGPALCRAGLTEQLLDALGSGAIGSRDRWLHILRPYLTREQAQRVLTFPAGGARVAVGPSRQPAALARLASFGADDAAQALDLVYEEVEEQLPDDVVRLLRQRLSNFQPEPEKEPHPYAAYGTTAYGRPWWEERVYLGVPWRRESGLSVYLRRPTDKGGLQAVLWSVLDDEDRSAETTRLLLGRPELRELLHPDLQQRLLDRESSALSTPDPVADDPTPGELAQPSVALAFEAVGGILPEDLPALRVLARIQKDPWAALTVLGAGTHLRQGELRNGVVAELRDGLVLLKQTSPGEAPWAGYRPGLPANCPWLMRLAGDWTPFFARILAPSVWPELKPLLFEGGYLDGVLRKHSWYMEQEEHTRLDDWAHDILAYTPLLDTGELDHIEAIGENVRSATTRGWFRAGVATGYAYQGEMPSAYATMTKIGGAEAHEAKQAALTETGALTQIAQLPAWLDQVHRTLTNPADRGPLWGRVLENRWPELSKDQCWEVLDRWLTATPLRSRTDVLADALAYAHPLYRLAGPGEVRRILTLVGIDPLNHHA
jgi:hypothetical protein